jgi:hypothetical protein
MKALPNSRNDASVFLPAKIHDHQSVVCECLPATIVKGLRTQFCWKAISGEAVDEKQIERFGGLRYKLRTIRTNDAKPGAVLRNAERAAQRDDMSIDFDNCQPGSWMMSVAPLGDRAAAKPDERDVAWPWHEAFERHHGPGVGEGQEVRIFDEHLALNEIGPKVKGNDPIFVRNDRNGASSMGRGLGFAFVAFDLGTGDT